MKVWRVGSKVPLNVYEGDRPVCQCHTAEDAERIVAALNTACPDRRLDEIMSRIYLRFKEWNKRGFSPGDVTWCEVRADVLAIIAAVCQEKA